MRERCVGMGEGRATIRYSTLARLTVLVCALVVVGLCVPAQAQEVQRGVTVTDRPRPELEPLGIRVGGFLFYPDISVSERYNDNIFSTNSGENDDFIPSIVPGSALKSNWNRHALNFSGRADIGRYLQTSDENYEDIFLDADGRVDITRRAKLSGALSYKRGHEARSSTDDVSGVNPSIFQVFGASLEFLQRFNRVSLSFQGAFRRLDFDDAVTPLDVVLNNDDRDRNEADFTLRAGYEIVPQYEAFVRATYYLRDYDDGVDDNGFNRDSNGFEIVAGTVIDFSGITFGDVFAGYRVQDSDDSDLETISGITFGAGITWNVTGLTTAKFKVTRIIHETTQIGASGGFATTIGATVDHELLRNLLIGGGVSLRRNDFEGIDRTDDELNAGVYGKYMLNRNLYMSLNYQYRMRDSNGSTSDFQSNVISLSLKTQI